MIKIPKHKYILLGLFETGDIIYPLASPGETLLPFLLLEKSALRIALIEHILENGTSDDK